MKNIRLLAERGEIIDAIGQLWQTEQCRNSHTAPDGWVREIVGRAAALPMALYECDFEHEPYHNLAWMRFIARRHHEGSPGLHDVALLRQLAYMAEMTYADTPWTEWFTKMAKASFEATFISECEAYVFLPGLREQTFPFEIWIDRFVAYYFHFVGDKSQNQYRAEQLREKRLAAVRSPDPFDFIELQLHSFNRQNLTWCDIWRKNYSRVERRMVQFCREAETDKGAAVANLHRWLMNDVIVVPGMTIPFHIEAERFYQEWLEHQTLWGNKNLMSG